MQLYLYAKSGHSFGLENVRRASALCNMLKSCDPILCTADYRAATFAKSELGVDKGVGVDVIGNMPNVMEKGDMLIYDDSGEASETMQHHMKGFCTHLYKVGEHIPFDIVDETYFEQIEKTREKAVFFADDDYANWFFDLVQTGKKQDIPLIWGHYLFFKNEATFGKFFNEIIEEEDYTEAIKSTKYLLTASVHASMESLASGNKPVFFKRGDKEPQNYSLIKEYNIPVVEGETMDELVKNFEDVIANYPEVKSVEKFDISEIKSEITATLKKFEMIKPALDYKF
ncbi:MAG: hypothetical protein U9Q33_05320 [Campylobacterota bacterium]|nr:hypothetical protein [Campylobacterota bacterium]